MRKGIFREPYFVSRDDAVVIHHIERGQNALAVGAHLDLGERLKTLGPVGLAIAVQVGDVFAPGVDGHTAQCQARALRRRACARLRGLGRTQGFGCSHGKRPSKQDVWQLGPVGRRPASHSLAQQSV